jgi:hypothetical protein
MAKPNNQFFKLNIFLLFIPNIKPIQSLILNIYPIILYDVSYVMDDKPIAATFRFRVR